MFNYTATISDYAVLTDAKDEFQRYEQALARYAEEGEGHNSDPSKRRYLFLFERTLRTRGRDHMQVRLLLIHHSYLYSYITYYITTMYIYTYITLIIHIKLYIQLMPVHIQTHVVPLTAAQCAACLDAFVRVAGKYALAFTEIQVRTHYNMCCTLYYTIY